MTPFGYYNSHLEVNFNVSQSVQPQIVIPPSLQYVQNPGPYALLVDIHARPKKHWTPKIKMRFRDRGEILTDLIFQQLPESPYLGRGV